MIVNIRFNIHGAVSLDLDRAREDPYWDQCAQRQTELKDTIVDYVTSYLRNEDILRNNAPFTCGPATIFNCDIILDETKLKENNNGEGKESSAKAGR